MHIRASEAFGKNVLKLAKDRKLNLAEMQMLLDNLSHKFAKASDGIENDNSISNMETRHWTALGILGFSNELTEALSTARINYLYYDKGLRGDALVSQFKKDALTQELSLGLPIYTGVGGPPVFKRKNASQPVYTKPETNAASDNNIGRQHQPHTSPKPLDSPNARRVPTGNFKLEGESPNAVLYRKNNDNRITSYAVYDAQGMIIKRVDMQGKPHGDVPTPHVIEYGRNRLPDGTVRVNSPRKMTPRPARPDELHYIKED